MDSETLQTFLEEVESYLPTMRQGIMAYEQDSTKVAELQTSRRQAHTIKGAALMVEQPEISEIAKEIESDLKKIIQSKKDLTEEAADDFLSRILILQSYLTNLRAELNHTLSPPTPLPPPPPAAQQEEAANPKEESPETLQTSDSSNESFPESETEKFEVDGEMLEVFAEEAEDLLRNIVTNLGVLEKTPDNRQALLEVRRSSHTLKGSAGIIGLKKLSALAHRVEDLLDYLAENEIESNERIFELLLASTDCFSALSSGENSPELNQKIKRIYQTFDEVLAALKADNSASEIAGRNGTTEKPAPLPQAAPAAIASESASAETTAAAENPAMETANANRSVVRVSVERLNDLFNLVSEMVISRSVFEQRLSELEQQIGELHHTTRRLRFSTGKLETDFETSAPVVPPAALNFPAYHLAGGGEKAVNPLADLKLEEFDSLEFDRYSEFNQTTRELVETTSDTSAINSNLDNLLGNLNLLFDNQRRLIEGMQDNLFRLRMVSLSTLSQRLQRAVRVTAQEEGKLVDLVIENETVDIDTEILDSFIEPLIHLLRNAVAHGIEMAETRRLLGKPERGKITLRAYSEGTHIVFVISDDGRGISVSDLKEKAAQTGFISKKEASAMADEDAYSLVFLPGLSTAAQINQVSGRGVGMNIVSSSIARRQGKISIKSEPQKGTSFTVRMPMALAVTRALLVKAGTQTFAFPLKLVKQVNEISREEFEKAQLLKILTLGENSYSFFYFNELLDLSSPSAALQNAKVPLILLETFETPCVLTVDQILKAEEIVIKPLGAGLQNIPEIVGATILGDGSVVPVLDLVYLLKKKEKGKGKKRDAAARRRGDAETNDAAGFDSSLSPRPVSVLIVDDSPSVRQVNSSLVKNAGWEVSVAKDGLEALEILQAMRQPPDVILTDVEMPRMDGYELLASLKRQPTLRDIPVIMLTSRAGDKHRRKAFDLGVNEYLTKPYEESVLLDKIKTLTKNV